MANKHFLKRGYLMKAIVLVLAAIITGFRIGCASLLVEGNALASRLHIALFALLATFLIVLISLVVLLKPKHPRKKASVWPIAITAGILGLAMAVFTVYDIVMWAGFEKTPAPCTTLMGTIDMVVLIGYMAAGLASSLYFIRLMLVWIAENTCYRGIFKVGALMPVMWMWLRIVRYELAHVSLFEMNFSIHDFAMLVFSMLFLFRIACLIAGIGNRKRGVTMFITAAAAMCALSSVAVRFGLYLSGDAMLYQTVELANGIDLCIGLFALAWVQYLWDDGLSSHGKGNHKEVRFLTESDNQPYQPEDFFEEPDAPAHHSDDQAQTADELFMDIISTRNNTHRDT